MYQATQNVPSDERFGLTQQMRPAAVSVAANIAEGRGRQTLADYIRFRYIAKGSLTQVEYYLHFAWRLGSLDAPSHNPLSQLQRMTARARIGVIPFTDNQLQQTQRSFVENGDVGNSLPP
ncbi:four helix bundle protein [Candidatus Poribacteria bacterium]|nr:four helix bundle protein [Candidatus Poribacteria bacterium]